MGANCPETVPFKCISSPYWNTEVTPIKSLPSNQKNRVFKSKWLGFRGQFTVKSFAPSLEVGAQMTLVNASEEKTHLGFGFDIEQSFLFAEKSQKKSFVFNLACNCNII